MNRALAFIVCGAPLLSGCYSVNSFVDAPDANPGDGVCARSAPGVKAAGAPTVAELKQLERQFVEKLSPAERARISKGDLQPLERPDLAQLRDAVQQRLGPEGRFDLTSPVRLCTLRAAIMEANAHPWKSTITVPAGTYKLSLGSLGISRSMRVQGSGAETTIVDADHGDFPIVHVEDGGDVEINHLTLRNAAPFAGGGLIIERGNVELEDMVVRDNVAYSTGGGLMIHPDATVRIRRSTIRGNAAAFGGGIRNDGTLWVYDSLIRDNQGNRAGGILNAGDLNLRNVTLSGNWADSPVAGVGGIWQGNFAFLNNVTITNNEGMGDVAWSWQGGGIQTASGATTVMRNSIVAGNDGQTGPDDCVGELSFDSRNNLIGDDEGCTITGYADTYLIDPDHGLGPLADNGGPTWTHLPGPGSPAREAGYGYPPPAADACEPLDQRGVPRPQGTGPECDLGAVEYTTSTARVTGFMLVDAATDTDIRPLRHDDVLVLSTLPPQLTVRALTGGFTGSVRFGLDGNPALHTENIAPYALGGDMGGDYAPVALAGGEHELRATPYAGADAGGAAGASRTIRFTVLASE